MVEDVASDLCKYLEQDLGLKLQEHKELSRSEIAFAASLGLMREQTGASQRRQTPQVACPFIQKFPEQLCGSWAAAPEGKAAKELLQPNGDVMTAQKMWHLVLFTWLGAGGLHTKPWEQIRSIPELAVYSPDPRQPLEVIRFAMLWVQRCGNHVLQFFGSDGRDKGTRFGRSAFLMLTDWHKAVPGLVEALDKGSSAFLSELRRTRGMGVLAQKEMLSYLGVSNHQRFCDLAAECIPFGDGAKRGASSFLGLTRGHLQAVKHKLPHLQDRCACPESLALLLRSDSRSFFKMVSRSLRSGGFEGCAGWVECWRSVCFADLAGQA